MADAPVDWLRSCRPNRCCEGGARSNLSPAIRV